MRSLSSTVTAVAVLLAVASVASARDFPRWHQLEKLKYSYADYVRDARRPHVHGSDAYRYREQVFNERLADIKKHNADPTQTWKRGINQFADWTAEEWKNYNRARPDFDTVKTLKQNVFLPAVNPTDLPKTADYRDRTNPPILTAVKNQGSCGSCWAHAATEEMESYFALRFGQLPVLSPQQVTSCTVTGVAGCGGGGLGAAWEAVQQYGGVNEEFTYPYTDFFAAKMEKNFTSLCQNISEKFPMINNGTNEFLFTWWPKANVTGFTRLTPNKATDMMEVLATTGPVAVTVASSQWPDYESGILQNNYKNNFTWLALDHDVQVVGYGYDFDLNENYWVVRNSWGTNYGENGFIRLLRPDVEPCGVLFGVTVCGTSGVLANGAYPEVKPLENQNGYYF